MAGWVGRTVGRVSIELMLARGVVADAYLGRDTTLQRAVTIRLFNSTFSDDPGLRDRFQREARSLASLKHPNIQQVLGFDNIDSRPYIVAEYTPGVSLEAHLRALRAASQPPDRRLAEVIVTSVAEALQFAHDRGVLHRELNPSHIILSSPSMPVEAGRQPPDDLRVLVADFGLAQFARPGGPANTQLLRTRAYMSPEQAAGSVTDHRADLYAFGAVVSEVILGQDPVLGSAPGAPQTRASLADAPGPLREALDRALSHEPDRRFQSAREMAAALRPALTLSAEPAAAIEQPEAGDAVVSVPPAARGRRLRAWVSTAIVGAAVLGLAGVLATRFLLAPMAPAVASTAAPAAAQDRPSAGPAVGDPIGVLRFQDGAAHVDEVSFSATGMPVAPPGSQYEVWLVTESGEERRSVGYLDLNSQGEGTISFVDAEGRNLLATYSGLEITVEPDPDPNPNPASTLAYAMQLPAEGLLHVRHILVSFGKAPNSTALLEGLITDAELAKSSAAAMLAAYTSGDEPAVRSEAEAILNMVLGTESAQYADWDGDAQIESLGDGYGLLLNGEQAGYIQGSFAHAEFAAQAPDATEQMQSHGEHVMVSARNVEAWTAQLRDLLGQIVAAPFDPSMGGLIRQAVALTDTILLGTDLNGNERIEAIAGEGGAQTAYQHALYMADMTVTMPE